MFTPTHCELRNVQKRQHTSSVTKWRCIVNHAPKHTSRTHRLSASTHMYRTQQRTQAVDALRTAQHTGSTRTHTHILQQHVTASTRLPDTRERECTRPQYPCVRLRGTQNEGQATNKRTRKQNQACPVTKWRCFNKPTADMRHEHCFEMFTTPTTTSPPHRAATTKKQPPRSLQPEMI